MATPTSWSLEAWNSSGGLRTLAGSPVNFTLPSQLVPASRSSFLMPANPYAMWTLMMAAYTGLPAASVTVSSTEHGPAPPSITGTSCVGWEADLGCGEGFGVAEVCVCAEDRTLPPTQVSRRMQQCSLISAFPGLYFGHRAPYLQQRGLPSL